MKQCSMPNNIELGQMLFGANIIQSKECPDWIIALLRDIGRKMDIVMWNKMQDEYNNPFENTGNDYIGNCFEVHAYNWDDDKSQPYNFKYKNIEISWYKYLGRGTTINGYYEPSQIISMYNDCLQEIEQLDDIDGFV